MKNEFVTTKIWQKTLRKLRIVSALRGESMAAFLDELVNREMPEGIVIEQVGDGTKKA